jgi:aspartate/glutamate racemase
MTVFKGGRTIYGEAIGILLLDTKFPRLPGDIGNATTFDFPVRYRVVKGATPQRLVLDNDESCLNDFVEAAKELEAEGVRAITTSCGYLTTFQDAITSAVKVPVFCSSLMLVPVVNRMLPPGSKIGVLTIDSRRLHQSTLTAAGITNEPIAIMGSEAIPEFYNTYPRGAMEIDPDEVAGAVVGMVKQLLEKNPEVRAIVCEAINYAPYAYAVQEATGLPWFDIIDMTKLVYNAVVKKPYQGYL